MSATKISDLLPIPEGAKTPHAYQVFGLEGGEQDSAKIKAAVAEVYQQLKQAKATTEPDLWRKAAKLVEKARAILTDPKKRAELDARFGVVNFDTPTDDDALQSDDPLAGVLPSSDPLASVLPSTDPLGSVVPSGDPMAVAAPGAAAVGVAPPGIASNAPNPMEPPTTTSIPTSQVQTPAASRSVTPTPHPVTVKAAKPKRRRKNSILGTLMFATFMVGMFAIIGVLFYFLAFGSGHLSVVSKDGEISISTTPQDTEPQIRQPGSTQSRRERRNGDGVMGEVPSGPSRPMGSLADVDPMKNMTAGMQAPEPTPPQPAPVEPKPMPVQPAPTPEPPPAKPEPEPAPEDPEMMLPVKSGEQESAPQEMTEEMIAAADKAIVEVENLIRQADWKRMKPAAETLTEMTLSEEQRVYAEALYNLAELATFYRGGIVRGIGTLQTASTFEIADGVPVLVVEKSEEGLTIRASARNRSYTLDDMPFRLAEKLAAFAVPPDRPDAIAGRSCFQSIAPKSTPEYRKDALSWLEFVNDDMEDVDTKQIADAIKKLFPD